MSIDFASDGAHYIVLTTGGLKPLLPTAFRTFSVPVSFAATCLSAMGKATADRRTASSREGVRRQAALSAAMADDVRSGGSARCNCFAPMHLRAPRATRHLVGAAE